MNQTISPVQFVEEEPKLNFSLNLSAFKNKNVNPYSDGKEPEANLEPPKKKRGRPKKEEGTVLGTTGIIKDNEGITDTYIGSTVPYTESYRETDTLLKTTIGQVDQMSVLVNNELTNIVNSKTLKNKYKYITDLTSTGSALLQTKISAIRELNKSITDSHNLEIKRIKDLKLAAAADAENDDRRMQEMYHSFISTPMNMGGNFGPSINELSLSSPNMIPMESTSDYGYQNYLNNLTPEQNRMRMEDTGNAETVLYYDPMTGARQFGVVDRFTGQPIPNMPVPSDIILENTNIDTRTNMARNRDINTTYRVIPTGAGNLENF